MKFIAIFPLALLLILSSTAGEGASPKADASSHLGDPILIVTTVDSFAPFAPYSISTIEFVFWTNGFSYCQSSTPKWIRLSESDTKSVIDQIRNTIANADQVMNTPAQREWRAYDSPYRMIEYRSGATNRVFKTIYEFPGESVKPQSANYAPFSETWQKLIGVKESICSGKFKSLIIKK